MLNGSAANNYKKKQNMRCHQQILWHDTCNGRICDMELGVSEVFTGQVPWGQKQENQQNTAFNTNHSIKDTESLLKPCNYAIIRTSLSEQKNTVLKSIHSHKIIDEGTKEQWTRVLMKHQSRLNAYLLHYY